MQVYSSSLPSIPSLTGFAEAVGAIGSQYCQSKLMTREQGERQGKAESCFLCLQSQTASPIEGSFIWGHLTEGRSQECRWGTKQKKVRDTLCIQVRKEINIKLFVILKNIYNHFLAISQACNLRQNWSHTITNSEQAGLYLKETCKGWGTVGKVSIDPSSSVLMDWWLFYVAYKATLKRTMFPLYGIKKM